MTSDRIVVIAAYLIELKNVGRKTGSNARA
jgi:hypothetical protein